ncbi:hypothetical protein [uncultured Microbulbifer sp.]|uniref:hypothetical protein n=1 Tax=uncultured Microbulbifer sp. TaxID=348147 RepID=UPI00261864F8|nr:hypothetical protein [uncultured Microbulbifer sp.]
MMSVSKKSEFSSMFGVGKFFLVLLVTIGFLYIAIGLSREFLQWFSWWRDGAEPIVLNGKIENVYEYKGRDKGMQRISFRNEDGSISHLHSLFSKSQLKSLYRPSVKLEIKYYISPIGKRYIVWVKSEGDVVYKGYMNRSGWLGVPFLVICMFFYSVPVFLFFALFGKKLEG